MPSTCPPRVLFSRYEDGCRLVTVLPDGWEVASACVGQPAQKFTTARSLLSALTGHPEGRHWSFDRYFRLGQFGTPEPDSNVLDLWPSISSLNVAVTTTPGISIPAPQDHDRAEKHSRTPENVSRTTENVSRPRESVSLDVESHSLGGECEIAVSRRVLGIDLRTRAHEVRKLLFAGFGRRMYLSGYDPEDVLQEVYKGLLVRNQGTCPWDPAKSSFGHYVHMVCSCVLNNYHRKQHRVRTMEQVGLLNPLGDDSPEGRYTDVASNVTLAARATTVQEDSLVLEEAEDLLARMQTQGDAESRLAARVLPLLLQGTPRDTISTTLGVSPASLSRAMAYLRKQATAWATFSP